MSVLIKGMEMPKSCESCKLLREVFNFISDDFEYFCQVTKCSIDRDIHNDRLGVKLDDCPLVEVPTPHGKLIDANNLLSDLNIKRYIGRDSDGNPMYEIVGRTTKISVRMVEDAPTIIEAEE